MPRPYCATRDKGPKWGHGPLYSEAACSGKDVFYEGSDDEDYESSAARRLRYEAAGKRFLDGEAPVIFSSVLKGPFDQDGGWKNPWRSRRHMSDKTLVTTTPSKVTKRRKTKPMRDDQLPEPQHSVECHLPSPESLKQASVHSHPFLEKDEVARVHSWRQSIQSPDLEQDDLSVVETQATIERPSVKKRRAKSSDWLKRSSSKRRKTDNADMRSIETPSRRRQQNIPVPKAQSTIKALRTSSLNTSFQSAPGRLPVSVGKCSLQRQHSSADQDGDELAGDGDVLEGPTSSFASSSGILSTPSRRTSPKKAVWRKETPDAMDSEDELAQDKLAGLKAAATLSSPVSIQEEVKISVRKRGTPRRKDAKSISDAKRLPTTVEVVEQHRSSPIPRPLDEHVDMEMEESEGGPVAPETCVQLENQDDTSCFGKHGNEAVVTDNATCEPSRQRESSPLSSLTSLDSETWSGLSSLEDEGALLTTGGTSTGSTAMTSATSDEGTKEDLLKSDSITVKTADPPAESCNTYPGKTNEDSPPACSLEEDCASDVDGSSELSELSSSDSFLDMQPIIGDDATIDSPAERGAKNSDDFIETTGDFIDNTMTQPEASDATASQGIPSTSEPTSNHNTEAMAAESTSLSNDEASRDHAETMTPSAPENTTDYCATDVDEPASTFSFRELIQRLLPAWHASVSAREAGRTTQSTETEQQNAHSELAGATEDLMDQAPITEPPRSGLQYVDNEESGLEAHSPQDTASTSSTWKTAEPAPAVDHTPLSPTAALMNRTNAEGLAQNLVVPPPSNAEVLSDRRVPKSQQISSPKPHMPTTSDVGIGEKPLEQSNDPRDISQIPTEESVPNQTPWGDANFPTTQNSEGPCDFEALIPTSTPLFAMPPRPSTPEPMFPLQPFSAFMTPSPEHRARQKQRAQWRISNCRSTGTQRLSSAMRSSWSSSKYGKRVSWAPLPGEKEDTAGVEMRERPASPPPMTAVEDLPTSKDAEFQGHFNAVARRASEMPKCLLPTDSQQSLDSNEIDSNEMAENFPTVDDIGKDGPAVVLNHFEPSHVETGEVNDVDMTDQVFQDLQDLLQPWDLDAELDQARQEPGLEGLGMDL